jgi:hypothetical protein
LVVGSIPTRPTNLNPLNQALTPNASYVPRGLGTQRAQYSATFV